jgi:adenylate cyclase
VPQDGFKRKLSVILSADVEGYSRLMGDDEEATVRTLTSYRKAMTALIQQHNGRVIDSPGDNLLAEFVSVVDAVQGAVAVQKELNSRNDQLPENRRMQFRIGINLGDVIQEDERIYGDGVNIAARLEGLSDPGGICISKTAFDQIESKLPYGYEFLGDQSVKNIAKPVGAYRVLMEPRVTVAEAPDAVVGKPAFSGQTSPAFRNYGNPGDYYAGGFVCLACAIGLPVFGYFIEKIGPGSFLPMAGAGILVGLIGASLILWGMLLRRREKAAKNRNHH